MMNDLRENHNWAFYGIQEGIGTYSDSDNVEYIPNDNVGSLEVDNEIINGVAMDRIFFLSMRVAATYDPNGEGTPSGGWTGYFSNHEDWYGVIAKIISSGDYLLENDEQKRAVADEFAKWVIANGWG